MEKGFANTPWPGSWNAGRNTSTDSAPGGPGNSWNPLATWAFGTNGAFSSILKIPTPGYRRFDGNFMNIGSEGRYRTSTISGTNVKNLLLSNFDGNYMIPDIRNMGGTVRCIKD